MLDYRPVDAPENRGHPVRESPVRYRRGGTGEMRPPRCIFLRVSWETFFDCKEADMQMVASIAARLTNPWFSFRDEESGQTLVEYALIIALIGLACVVALGFLSGKIQQLFSDAGSSLGS